LARDHLDLFSFPTRRSSDLFLCLSRSVKVPFWRLSRVPGFVAYLAIPSVDLAPFIAFSGRVFVTVPRAKRSLFLAPVSSWRQSRSEEHTSELQSRFDLVCRL